jgi:hypothetical protein
MHPPAAIRDRRSKRGQGNDRPGQEGAASRTLTAKAGKKRMRIFVIAGVPQQPSELPLRCRCGHLRGVASELSPRGGFRFVCYCKDCQAFARFLARPDMLDPAGGTDILQMPAARVTLAAGTDALRCLRLSPGGVLRWYTECCRTPIANTAASPRFPVAALIHSFIGRDPGGRTRDEVLGPPLCGLYRGSAIGPLPPDAPAPPSMGVSLRRASKVLGWWMHGLARPSPFFDDRTKAPRAVPRVLTGFAEEECARTDV